MHIGNYMYPLVYPPDLSNFPADLICGFRLIAKTSDYYFLFCYTMQFTFQRDV
jgi:hypothetical protein